MPYKTNHDLPEDVKHLPLQAQDIYRETFNIAWEEYKDPQTRRQGGSREEIAHRIAWEAVERQYQKGDGHWVAKA